MSRTITILLPPERTDAVAARLGGCEGVVGLGLQRGGSLKPAGDVLTVQATNQGLAAARRVLDEHGIGTEVGLVTTGNPSSLIAAQGQDAISCEDDEADWEEMNTLMRQDTNIGSNFLLAMFLAGVVAAAGLWTDTLHIVIGAMVIAPGFEPILRVPFGLLGGRNQATLHGLKSTAGGYAALLLGAALAMLFLGMASPSAASLGEQHWVQYWTKAEISSVLVSLAAGAAGAVIIAAQHSVLTTGVMIALALIPTMTIVGMAVVSLEFVLAGKALLRWALDVVCVVAGGGSVFLLKRRMQHRGAA
ncbi:DUF389 domain-containing protein [Teichococcus aestuarii]|uniref:DUF389 domain-containing protein n=1 Tax=Teichococcus aestuarii TaxID=568898 RepID=A0A2U1V906_9PROT|nr:DUF389 domain-containing protein [Pseudoroseomonas aestuarii]PWC30383.1 hypothetical protein CR165_00235 [Pseudoroseomonas aestuarii]